MKEQLILVGKRYVDHRRLASQMQKTFAEGDSKRPGIICGEVREDECCFLRFDFGELWLVRVGWVEESVGHARIRGGFLEGCSYLSFY